VELRSASSGKLQFHSSVSLIDHQLCKTRLIFEPHKTKIYIYIRMSWDISIRRLSTKRATGSRFPSEAEFLSSPPRLDSVVHSVSYVMRIICLLQVKGKVVSVLNQVPRHEDILEWRYSYTYS
jgi:hypothetical protein